MKKIAFQGEKGAFSEDAALHFWGPDAEPVPLNRFRDVFHAVAEGRCDFGILPIENSHTGSIHQNMDLLLEYNLSVCGEIILRIHHYLLAVRGARMGDIRRILSHPQAIEQCSKFLEGLAGVEIVPAYDTAGSARLVFEQNRKDQAAIASQRAGLDYGLVPIEKKIENDDQNFTRFIAVAREPLGLDREAKTSIVFSTKNIPGALFKALSVFALRDINLLKIESRPLRKGPWKYYFYLDFEGSLSSAACQNAINHLGEIASYLKVLGSYSKGRVVL
jgi:prephenate dehydratase